MFSKKRFGRLAAVLVFALAVSGASVYHESIDKETSLSPVEESSDLEEIQVDFQANIELAAGITSELMTQAISKNDQPAPETEPSDEEIDFGYKNLGIANITTGNLNIRDKASKTGKVVGKMTKHNACEILEEKDGWYKIKSGKVKGYVSSEFIVTGDEAMAIALEEAADIATVVNTATLRIRYEATTESKTLQLIGRGEDLVVIEKLDGWYKVEADDDKEGYISADYAEVSKQLPVAKSFSEVTKSSGVSETRAALVSYACQFIGNKYVWGGSSLTKGVDCSGFTMQVYKRYGIKLPHRAALQKNYGKKINAKDARPGDLFFYGKGKTINHVAIYIGNGKIVHAANKRAGIKISNAYYRSPICVVSYLK